MRCDRSVLWLVCLTFSLLYACAEGESQSITSDTNPQSDATSPTDVPTTTDATSPTDTTSPTDVPTTTDIPTTTDTNSPTDTSISPDTDANPTCGDGLQQPGEACDDNNLFPDDGCSTSCTQEAGFVCSGSPSSCATVCGDGLTRGDETCDDSNGSPSDGCSATCLTEPGYACSGAPSQCSTGCGDGFTAGSEACDDANALPGDGCSPACALEEGFSCIGAPSVCSTRCGDGLTVAQETCDDGNVTSGDYCSADCQTITGYCGDNIRQNNELCDDGNNASSDYCAPDCQTANGSCGDGTRQANEVCDDGNNSPNDYCSSDCQIANGSCGDGIQQTNEACDDANISANDYCSANCQSITGRCGDNLQQSNEACDDGNTNNQDACLNTCSTASCGDSVIYSGAETCDDGNNQNSDGCASNCALEIPFAGQSVTLSGDINSSDPTWTRPYADCSVGSGSYFYEPFTVVNNTGSEQRVRFTADWGGDGYLHVYREPFNPADPLTSCVLGSDDYMGTARSQVNDQPILPGERRVIVASTYTSGALLGPFTLTVTSLNGLCGNGILNAPEYCDDGNNASGDSCSAACGRELPAAGGSVTITGSIATTDPLWTRPGSGAGCTSFPGSSSSYYYDTHLITNVTTSTVTITATSTWTGGDGYLHLFSLPFDPSNQLQNCVFGNDDSSGTGQSQIAGQTLAPGESRVIVASTFSTTATISSYSLVVGVQ